MSYEAFGGPVVSRSWLCVLKSSIASVASSWISRVLAMIYRPSYTENIRVTKSQSYIPPPPNKIIIAIVLIFKTLDL